MSNEFAYIEVMELGYARVSAYGSHGKEGRLTNCICYQSKTPGLESNYGLKGNHQCQWIAIRIRTLATYLQFQLQRKQC